MSQSGHIDINKLIGHIGQNDKSTLCRQISYFDKCSLCGEKGRKLKISISSIRQFNIFLLSCERLEI